MPSPWSDDRDVPSASPFLDGGGRDPDDLLVPRIGESLLVTFGRLGVGVFVCLMLASIAGVSASQAWALLAVVTVVGLVPVGGARVAFSAAGGVWLVGATFVSEPVGELTLGVERWGHLAVMAAAAAVAAAVTRRARHVSRGSWLR